jgi:hypothetical protein
VTKKEILDLMVARVASGMLNPLEVVKFELTGEMSEKVRQLLGLLPSEIVNDSTETKPASQSKGKGNMIRRKRGDW